MKKTLFLITVAILLRACTTIRENPLISSSELSDWNYFSLESNIIFKQHIKRDDGSVALTTYDTSTTTRIPSDFSIHLYPKASPCSLSSIGISSPMLEEANNGEYRMWGEVDQKNDGSYPDPNCRVKSVYPHKNPYEQMTAYAFCSQKEEKTVLICISQMTDNPKLAEEIFSTFRWLP